MKTIFSGSFIIFTSLFLIACKTSPVSLHILSYKEDNKPIAGALCRDETLKFFQVSKIRPSPVISDANGYVNMPGDCLSIEIICKGYLPTSYHGGDGNIYLYPVQDSDWVQQNLRASRLYSSSSKVKGQTINYGIQYKYPEDTADTACRRWNEVVHWYYRLRGWE